MTSSVGQLFDKEATRTWNILGKLSDEDLHRPIRDDGWSAFQIVAHLATATRGLIQIAHHGLKQPEAHEQPTSPLGADFDLHRWNLEQMAAWKDKSREDLQAAWQVSSNAFHDFVEHVADEDLDREFHTPMGQSIVLSNLLSMITMHLRIHRQEIEQGLANGIATAIEH